MKDLRVFITFYLAPQTHTLAHPPRNLFNFKSFLNQFANECEITECTRKIIAKWMYDLYASQIYAKNANASHEFMPNVKRSLFLFFSFSLSLSFHILIITYICDPRDTTCSIVFLFFLHHLFHIYIFPISRNTFIFILHSLFSFRCSCIVLHLCLALQKRTICMEKYLMCHVSCLRIKRRRRRR